MKIDYLPALLIVITSSLLVMIAYDDFKLRTIRVILLPFIFILLAVHRLTSEPIELLIFDLLCNVTYIIMLAIFVMAYLYFKYRVTWSKLSSYIGLGDLLFILSITVWFSVDSFIFFTTASLMITLAASVIVAHKYKTIPLAGYQSICFLVVYILSALIPW